MPTLYTHATSIISSATSRQLMLFIECTTDDKIILLHSKKKKEQPTGRRICFHGIRFKLVFDLETVCHTPGEGLLE